MFPVTRFTGKKPDGTLVRQIIYGSSATSKAMRFGQDNEDLARQLYTFAHQLQHPDVNVKQTGLHLDPDRPFLAASPYGLVDCPQCGPGLVEIKCSYKYRNMEPGDAAVQQGYHFLLDENNLISLRLNSSWYYQVQCQLGACRRACCDVVLFTSKGIAICKVIAAPSVWDEIKSKSRMFFEKYIIPKLF